MGMKGVEKRFAKTVMGRQVRYTQVLTRIRNYSETGRYRKDWRVDELEEPVVGWAVGIRYLCRGYIVGPFAEDQATLVETDPRIPCALVTGWPTRKPDKVPLDAIELLDEPVALSKWSDEDRKLWSDMSKGWPRDEKGRFLPEPNLTGGPGPAR